MKDMARSYNPTSPCLPRTCHTSSSPRKSSPKPPFIAPHRLLVQLREELPCSWLGRLATSLVNPGSEYWISTSNEGSKWPGQGCCLCPACADAPASQHFQNVSEHQESGWSLGHWSGWSVGHWSGQIGKTAVVGSAVDCINLVLDFRSLLHDFCVFSPIPLFVVHWIDTIV